MGLKQNRIATFSTCKQISVKAKMKVLYLAGDLMEDFVVGSTLLWALGKLTQKIKVLDLLLFSFGLKVPKS